MGGGLPDYIEPLRLAEAAAVLQGQLELSRCERICSDCGPQSGCADLTLQFGTDEEKQPYLVLQVRAVVRLQCSRCLAEMDWPLNTRVTLAIVSSDARAAELADRYEPLVVTAGPLALAGLVEDELLLAMPAVAMHPREECVSALNPAPTDGAERESPFAVLADLKRQGH